MVQISEQDLLEQHIICPKTKDIKTLKYLQDLGYTLYFLDKEKYVCKVHLFYNDNKFPYLHQFLMRRTIISDLNEFNFVTENNYRIRELPDKSNFIAAALFKPVGEYSLEIKYEGCY